MMIFFIGTPGGGRREAVPSILASPRPARELPPVTRRRRVKGARRRPGVHLSHVVNDRPYPAVHAGNLRPHVQEIDSTWSIASRARGTSPRMATHGTPRADRK